MINNKVDAGERYSESELMQVRSANDRVAGDGDSTGVIETDRFNNKVDAGDIYSETELMQAGITNDRILAGCDKMLASTDRVYRGCDKMVASAELMKANHIDNRLDYGEVCENWDTGIRQNSNKDHKRKPEVTSTLFIPTSKGSLLFKLICDEE